MRNKPHLDAIREFAAQKDYKSFIELLEDLPRKIEDNKLGPDNNEQDEDLNLQDGDSKDQKVYDPETAFDEGLKILEEIFPIIRNLLQDTSEDSEVRAAAIRAMKMNKELSPNDFKMLVELAIYDRDAFIRKTAFKVLTEDRPKAVTDDPSLLCESPHIPSQIRNIFHRGGLGRRLVEVIPKLVLMADTDGTLAQDVMELALAPKSPLVKQYCDFVIKDPGKFFLAYEFEHSELPVAIEHYFKNHDPPYQIVMAGERLNKMTISGEIIEKLLCSSFAIFDLSPSRKKELNPGGASNLPNYNVVLELGFAMAFGIPSIMLFCKGTFPITDLQGWQRIEYENINDISEELDKKFNDEAWKKFIAGV